MPRLLLLFAALLIAPVGFAADEKNAELKGKVDKAKMFEVMDADADGSVSKKEFTAGMEKVVEKMKEKAATRGGRAADMLDKLGGQIGGKLFDKLDADADGKLTRAEFEKAEFEPGKMRELFGKLRDKK